MPEMHFLQDLLVLFGLGIVAVVAFHRLNLPPVLGFLITGVICGPFGFKLVNAGQGIESLAEIGLVLLLFTIGIEFSVKTFLRLKKFLLIAGGLQILLTIGAGALVGHFTSLPWTTSVFIGMLTALSSTAIVIRIMEYRGDLDSAHGRAALSILIFQDLCIVPMVLITPFLGGEGGSLTDVALLSGKALLFLALAGTIARFIVPWLLNQVAKTKKREAFVLSIILLCLGTATATSHFGLSMALGAFIAGLIVSESKYSHQALGEVVPFREVFNCLVFVSIGMLFDVRVLLHQPLLIVTALAVLILVKTLVGAGVTALMGHSLRVALLTGCAIAQVSEFSFVLAKVGSNVGLLDAETNQVFLAVAILSMFLTPAVLNGGTKISDLLDRFLAGRLGGSSADNAAHAEKPRDHVIIIGYGVSGRTLAGALAEAGVRYVVVEHDPEIVRSEQRAGVPIMYGDAARAEVLHHAGIENARVVALTVSDPDTVMRGAELANRLNSKLHIVARARYLDELKPLMLVGADQVVAEELVGSLEILSRVMQNYPVSKDAMEAFAQRIRDKEARASHALLTARRHLEDAERIWHEEDSKK